MRISDWSSDVCSSDLGALTTANETVHRIGLIEKGTRGCTVEGPAGCWGAKEDWSAAQHASPPIFFPGEGRRPVSGQPSLDPGLRWGTAIRIRTKSTSLSRGADPT